MSTKLIDCRKVCDKYYKASKKQSLRRIDSFVKMINAKEREGSISLCAAYDPDEYSTIRDAYVDYKSTLAW